jgi:hypothetical protein
MLFKGKMRVESGVGTFIDLTNIETNVVKTLTYEWSKKNKERDGVVPQVSKIPGFVFLFTANNEHFFECDLDNFIALMNS